MSLEIFPLRRPTRRAETRSFLWAVVVGLGIFVVSSASPALAAEEEFHLEEVVTGLSSPVGVEAEPGTSRLFVIEKSGRIRIVDDGRIAGTFLDIRSLVSTQGERGLLGLAFHPEYASNGKLYINYTNNSGDTRVVEYTARSDRNSAIASSARTLVAIDQVASNHNGGDLAFGPDGYLYIASGDGGGVAGRANGQDTGTLLGGLLRIDVATGQAPPDNPFVGRPGADRLWAYGLRNPWRFTIDAPTGNVIIGDVGQNRYEEIDLTNIDEGGVNFGWARLEGPACFSPSSGCATPGARAPLHYYSHSLGQTVTGGHVYRGDDLVGFQGHYFYGDFGAGWVRSFRISGGDAVSHTDWTGRIGTVPNLVSFGVDHDDELLLVSIRGTIYRLVGPRSPLGRFERLVTDGGEVSAVGWTFDPSVSSASIPVHVYVDGRFASGARADRPRADVNRVFGISGDHGFRVEVDADPGDRVCVYGINDGDASLGGHTLLGCETVPPNRSPLGRLEQLEFENGVATAVGWTFDPSVSSLSIPVHVYVDGRFEAGETADNARRDVNRVFGIAGDHGFRVEVDAGPGDRVCVYGINDGDASLGGHTLLECETVPPNRSPLGRLERVVVDSGVVSAVGWTFDPSMSAESIPVHVYVDGRFEAGESADNRRPDVNRVFSIGGDHGFRVEVAAGPGDRVCVYGINDGDPSVGDHTLLGCQMLSTGD